MRYANNVNICSLIDKRNLALNDWSSSITTSSSTWREPDLPSALIEASGWGRVGDWNPPPIKCNILWILLSQNKFFHDNSSYTLSLST